MQDGDNFTYQEKEKCEKKRIFIFHFRDRSVVLIQTGPERLAGGVTVGVKAINLEE